MDGPSRFFMGNFVRFQVNVFFANFFHVQQEGKTELYDVFFLVYHGKANKRGMELVLLKIKLVSFVIKINKNTVSIWKSILI